MGGHRIDWISRVLLNYEITKLPVSKAREPGKVTAAAARVVDVEVVMEAAGSVNTSSNQRQN